MDESKIRILEWVLATEEKPTLAEIATGTESSEAFIRESFRTVDDILQQCFVYLLIEAEKKASAVNPPQESLFEQRLGALVFIYLDELEAHDAFCRLWFARHAGRFGSPLQAALRSSIGNLIKADDVAAVNQVLFDNVPVRFVIAESIISLILTWIKDSTDKREKSTALIDRSITFWTSIVTSEVPQSATDLLRYAIEAGYLPIKNLPFIRDFFETAKSPSAEQNT